MAAPARLKVLWLSHFVPYPPKGGAFQRSYNLIRGAGAEHEVHLLALQHKTGSHPAEYAREAANELGRHCASVEIVDGTSATRGAGLALRGMKLLAGVPLTVSVSDVAEFRARLRALLAREKFDLVHLDTIGLGCYLDELGSTPAVMAHHGAEAFMMLRRVAREPSLLRKLVFWIEGRLLRRYESRTCARVARNFTCSSLDSELMGRHAPAARFTVVPNGVDIDYFHAMAPAATRSVLFAGRLDQYSNRDAIRWFAHQVWPRVRGRFPDATLDIIGSNPPADLSELAARDATVRVHGFVPDIRPYFANAAVAICPIRDGGGTRVKILDNLAMARPIVSTSIGIEGIDAVGERDLLIADSAEAFEKQIARIFEDAGLRARLCTQARRLAETRYAWSGIVATMLAAYGEARAEAQQVRST
jgi:glycosyltransferase involved in cell wall biosynthesis